MTVGDAFVYHTAEEVVDYLGIALQKDSELIEPFNYQMLKLEQSGLLRYLIYEIYKLNNNYRKLLFRKLISNYFPMTDNTNSVQGEANSLGFNNLLFLFMTLVMGIGISLLVLIKEKCSVMAFKQQGTEKHKQWTK